MLRVVRGMVRRLAVGVGIAACRVPAFVLGWFVLGLASCSVSSGLYVLLVVVLRRLWCFRGLYLSLQFHRWCLSSERGWSKRRFGPGFYAVLFQRCLGMCRLVHCVLSLYPSWGVGVVVYGLPCCCVGVGCMVGCNIVMCCVLRPIASHASLSLDDICLIYHLSVLYILFSLCEKCVFVL